MDNYIKTIKGLAEKNRIRILALLHRVKTEVCVCEIVDALEECQYNVSRHLKVLQQAGLIVSRKKGKWNYYRLNEKQVPFQEKLLQAVSYISSETINEDFKRLRKRLSIRVNNECVIGISKNNDQQ
ncbi:MAG: metalloregulator ArsR/SmtB family transcription factor [Bacillota bacterium]|nr:metalloregulator ArsR/SmtB family transcription factor [Bacillota bacterium]